MPLLGLCVNGVTEAKVVDRRAREEPRVGCGPLPDSKSQIKTLVGGGGRIQPEERPTCARLPRQASWRRHELKQALQRQVATAQRGEAGRPIQEEGTEETKAEKQE